MFFVFVTKIDLSQLAIKEFIEENHEENHENYNFFIVNFGQKKFLHFVLKYCNNFLSLNFFLKNIIINK